MEATQLVPKPGSVTWRYAGDVRLLSTGGYALLLQVAHPTVGAGVTEHSDFKADPWGRLLRTLDYSYTMTYGGPQVAAEMGQRIRGMHKQIKGMRPDGERYHALEPEAYAWVHGTLAHSIVRGHELLGKPMRPDQIETFYAEWRLTGQLIGVRERDLPEDWTAFQEYFAQMTEKLERTAAVDEVIESFQSPTRPNLRYLPRPAWRLAQLPATHQINLVTAGLLGPELRTRFAIPWSRTRKREFQLMAATSRATTPLLPRQLRNVGPSYLHWRRTAIASPS